MSKQAIWKWVAGLLFAAAFVALIQSSILKQFVLTPVAVAELLGRTTAVFLLPGVIPLLWWSFAKFRLDKAKFALTLWTVLFFGLSFLSLWGASIEVRHSSEITPFVGSEHYEFRPEGCEYTVTFPRTPKIKTISTLKYGTYLMAELIDSSSASVMKAECIPANFGGLAKLRTQNELLDTIKQYVEFQGFQFPTYEFEVTSLGSVGKARGYKRLSGVPVTYETIWHIGSRSAMNLLVGGPSSEYPQNGIVEFLLSISRQEAIK